MDNIGDDGSYFDPDEDGDDFGRISGQEGGLPIRFVPIPAGAKPNDKSDHFQSDLTRLIGAIKATLPQRYCYLEPTRQIFDIIGEKVVCGLLRVVAHLHDTEGDNWHYLIEFADRTGTVKEILISAEELDLHANALSHRLVRKGFPLFASASALSTLVRHWDRHGMGTIITQPGWARLADGSLVFADATGDVIYDPQFRRPLARAVTHAGPRQVAGTLSGWQDGVATLAVGNPALVFALSLAVAAPLLDLANAAPIGVNFYARTSSGKSTALKVMTSVYSNPGKLGSWNATRTALEISAMQANDGLLALDEFPSRPEPWRVSALMALGNGVGWARSNLALTLTQAHRWRTVVASSAERSIRHFMNAAGIQLPEGASVRMIDVPVRRWTYGLFADLHGHSNGQIFSEVLAKNAAEHHGHAGRTFMRWIIRHEASLRNDLPARVRAAEDKIREHLSQDAPASEIGRVLHALALVAVAGEYATECDVLPWPAGTAIAAVCRIAELWISRRDGEMPDSTRDLLEKIRANLAAFCDLDRRGNALASAIGWKKGDWIYILPDTLASLSGRSAQAAARDLEVEGVLERGSEKNCLLHRFTAPGKGGRRRVYRLRLSAIDELLREADLR
jgi:putative DNA primase/helicase